MSFTYEQMKGIIECNSASLQHLYTVAYKDRYDDIFFKYVELYLKGNEKSIEFSGFREKYDTLKKEFENLQKEYTKLSDKYMGLQTNLEQAINDRNIISKNYNKLVVETAVKENNHPW